MTFAKRTDLNHAEIRDGIREAGYTVFDLSKVGGGMADLAVRDPVYDVVTLVEVKSKAGKLNAEQIKFHDKWGGASCVVVYSLEQALQALTIQRQRVHR